MERHLTSWFSPRLEREMPIAVYGHYGFVLLLVPTAAADFLEYDRFHLIDSIRYFIVSGKVKLFSINSMYNESWMNNHVHP
ncbi:MAG: esterase, partial [Flavisolibacter sp.]|nr:esterase [Flavisolibacter sp.]